MKLNYDAKLFRNIFEVFINAPMNNKRPEKLIFRSLKMIL